MKDRPYTTLALAVGAHFFIMLALTYVGVAELAHVHLNLNRFYMAVVMVAPMVVVMLIAMRHMFKDHRRNAVLHVVSALVFVGALYAIRSQAFVGDAQLSLSMIPHHSIAIKTCEQAKLTDAETIQLCEEIVQAQREEIAQMEGILDRLRD